MALNDDLATLKTELSNGYRSKMEAKFNLVANPDYQATELQKAGDVIAELMAEIVMPYLQANAELENAELTDLSVTVDTGGGGQSVVNDGTVEGGIK